MYGESEDSLNRDREECQSNSDDYNGSNHDAYESRCSLDGKNRQGGAGGHKFENFNLIRIQSEASDDRSRESRKNSDCYLNGSIIIEESDDELDTNDTTKA
jgi:hypothetical protein